MVHRIGLIGAGVIGRLRARTVHANAQTTLAAIFDPDPALAAAAAVGGAVPVTSLDALFDQPLDAVIISSPVHVHEAATLEAFARGLHVLCEKPLSNTVAGCSRMVAAAVAADRIFAVGFNQRLLPSMQYIRDILDAGTIGALDHVRLFGGHEGLANFRADWQYRMPESGGGATMDIGIHMADFGRYFLGDITEVYGTASERVWKVPGSEDNAIAIFHNQHGTPASYHATWNEWAGFRLVVEVYGELGMVRGSYGPMRNTLITHERPGARRRTTRKFYPDVILREKLQSWEVTTQLSFAEELTQFVARMEGTPGGALADGHDGLRAVEVAHAIRQSATTRQVVQLPPLGRMR
jgi:predicted dehydrogenase